MQRRKPVTYTDDQLLDMRQCAKALGYSALYFQNLVSPAAAEYDEDLFRLRIETDPTYRRAFSTRALYVWQYGELVQWFTERQSSPSMKEWNAARGIIVE